MFNLYPFSWLLLVFCLLLDLESHILQIFKNLSVFSSWLGLEVDLFQSFLLLKHLSDLDLWLLRKLDLNNLQILLYLFLTKHGNTNNLLFISSYLLHSTIFFFIFLFKFMLIKLEIRLAHFTNKIYLTIKLLDFN